MAKQINVDLVELEALAAKGYSVAMCCSAIGIAKQTAYNNKYIMDAIRAGHAKARQRVVDDLMTRSRDDQGATASIYLSKQLKIFDDYFTTSKPKNIGDAIKRISTIYHAVARNELDIDKGSKLVGYLESYIKAYELSELEKRLEILEQSGNEK